MSPVSNFIIWFLFIFFSYHLIRDILQDIFNIHNPLIDFLHMTPKHGKHFLGRYFKFWGIPFEVGVFLLSLISISSNSFGISEMIAIFLFVIFISLWVWTSFKLNFLKKIIPV